MQFDLGVLRRVYILYGDEGPIVPDILEDMLEVFKDLFQVGLEVEVGVDVLQYIKIIIISFILCVFCRDCYVLQLDQDFLDYVFYGVDLEVVGQVGEVFIVVRFL